MCSEYLKIPAVFATRILNEFLSFVETQGSGAPFASINRCWNENKKRADQQLRHLTIDHNMDAVLDILERAKTLTKLRSISIVNLTPSQAWSLVDLRCFRFPATVISLRIEAADEVTEINDLPLFIWKNKHISSFHFNDCFDTMACETTSRNLPNYFTKNNPLKARVQVGKFVTLEPVCRSHTQAKDPPYALRWIGQCPVDNCQEHLCWSLESDCTCSKGRISLYRCCDKYKWITPFICLKHSKQHFMKGAGGKYMCGDCLNRQGAIL